MLDLKKWLQGNPSSCPSPTTSTPSILLLDGGVSTYLESALLRERDNDPQQQQPQQQDQQPVFSHRELWSSSLLLNPSGRDAIQSCHETFYEHGSDIASTVTYQCHYGCCALSDATMDEMLKDGVRLARRAAERAKNRRDESGDTRRRCRRLVAGSIGCYGAALADGSEYTGNYNRSVTDLISFHERKFQILASCNPDVIAFETIPSFVECRAVLSLLQQQQQQQQQHRIDMPCCWLSFSCKDDRHLNDGTDFETVLKEIATRDPFMELVPAIGVNCCAWEMSSHYSKPWSDTCYLQIKNAPLCFIPTAKTNLERGYGMYVAG